LKCGRRDDHAGDCGKELREHATALRELGVNLTAYLTQARADRVIELRGSGRPHVHLEPSTAERGANGSK
jgi:hypothetical protein